jgi:putative nucleotidyltransferase with HDIG domain
VSIINASYFSQKGFCMSTQPLLQESIPDTREFVLAPLQSEETQGCVTSIHIPGQDQYGLFELPQDIATNRQTVEFKTVHEIPLFNHLREEFSEIFSSLVPVLKAKDLELYRHSARVHSLALSFSTTTLLLSESESLKIGLAAFYHDIGKLHIHNAILQKAAGLSPQEYEIIKNHPAYGAEILSEFKLIKHVIPSLYHHHERLDGKGYPDGLRGKAIPLGARIIAIADAFEVMTSHRNYQESRSSMQALEELYEHAGTQFDAELVELFRAFYEISPHL